MVINRIFCLVLISLFTCGAHAVEPFTYEATDQSITEVLAAVSAHFDEEATVWPGQDREAKVTVKLNAKTFLEAVAQVSIQTGLGFSGSSGTVHFQDDQTPPDAYAIAGDTVVLLTGPGPAKEVKGRFGKDTDSGTAFALTALRWLEKSGGTTFKNIKLSAEAESAEIKPDNSFFTSGLKSTRVFPLPDAWLGRTATLSGDLEVSSYLPPTKLALPVKGGSAVAEGDVSAKVIGIETGKLKLHVDYPSGATPEQVAFMRQLMADFRAGKRPDAARMKEAEELRGKIKVYSLTEAYLTLADGTKSEFMGHNASSSPMDGIDAAYDLRDGVDLTGATLHIEVSEQAAKIYPFSFEKVAIPGS